MSTPRSPIRAVCPAARGHLPGEYAHRGRVPRGRTPAGHPDARAAPPDPEPAQGRRGREEKAEEARLYPEGPPVQSPVPTPEAVEPSLNKQGKQVRQQMIDQRTKQG